MGKLFFIVFALFTIFALVKCDVFRKKTAINAEISKSYYKNSSGTVIYSPMGNSFELGHTEMLDVDNATFEPIAETLAKDKNSVYWCAKKQPQLNVKTFRINEKGVLRDDKNVYTYESKLIAIENADPETYQYIDYNWSKDKNYYFLKTKKVIVDYQSFVIINKDFCTDKNNNYFFDDTKLSPISNFDGTITQIDSTNYFKNNNYIFYIGYKTNDDAVSTKYYLKTPFKPANKITVLNRKVLKVNNSIIYEGALFPVLDVDFESFSVFENELGYSKDKNHVYYKTNTIINADVKTFQPNKDTMLAGDVYFQDKNHVYFEGKILPNVDPKTFHKDTKTYNFIDKNSNEYREGKKIKN